MAHAHLEAFSMVTAATGEADGRAALAAACVTDLATMERVVARPGPRAPAVDTLARHEHLYLPADTLDRRTFSPVRGAR
jgi:hypothetical protein